MFDRISPTYDTLNRIFSIGIDRLWRKDAIRSLELKSGDSVLDCSAGTGDMAITAMRQCAGIQAVLLDPARLMLSIAREKLVTEDSQCFLMQGVAESLPFPDNYFDHFMVAFGIRNFSDLSKGMAELWRVTKPGGSGTILEFTPDRSPIIDRVFRFYMWGIMRPLGALVSRDRKAYAYLARTVKNFPITASLVDLFKEAGFSRVETKALSLGIASRFLLHK
jgi:demethylmenaquinone methyltransferase/2-methoxy-6-polyprenyl-1,4-benzoquinol methylase